MTAETGGDVEAPMDRAEASTSTCQRFLCASDTQCGEQTAPLAAMGKAKRPWGRGESRRGRKEGRERGGGTKGRE